MKKQTLFALALAAGLPLGSGRAAQAAGSPGNVVAQAAGDKDPVTLSWKDDTNGNVQTDDPMTQKVHDLFAGVQYQVTDQGQMLIIPANGSSAKPLVPALDAVDTDNGKGFYVVHLRAPGMFLNGKVIRFSDDQAHGIAKLDLVLINQQGVSEVTHIYQPLTWSSGQPQGGTTGTTNPFGF